MVDLKKLLLALKSIYGPTLFDKSYSHLFCEDLEEREFHRQIWRRQFFRYEDSYTGYALDYLMKRNKEGGERFPPTLEELLGFYERVKRDFERKYEISNNRQLKIEVTSDENFIENAKKMLLDGREKGHEFWAEKVIRVMCYSRAKHLKCSASDFLNKLGLN